jgi:hypothetical protein
LTQMKNKLMKNNFFLHNDDERDINTLLTGCKFFVNIHM